MSIWDEIKKLERMGYTSKQVIPRIQAPSPEEARVHQAAGQRQVVSPVKTFFKEALSFAEPFSKVGGIRISAAQQKKDTARMLEESERTLQAAKRLRQQGKTKEAARLTRQQGKLIAARTPTVPTQKTSEVAGELFGGGIRAGLTIGGLTSGAAPLATSMAVGGGLNVGLGALLGDERSVGERFLAGAGGGIKFAGLNRLTDPYIVKALGQNPALIKRIGVKSLGNFLEDVTYTALTEQRPLTRQEALFSITLPAIFETGTSFFKAVKGKPSIELKADEDGLYYDPRTKNYHDPITKKMVSTPEEIKQAKLNQRRIRAAGGGTFEEGKRANLIEVEPNKWVNENDMEMFKSEIDVDEPKIEGEDDLTAEARKYKSAEEFVKAQGKPVFHGTASKFEIFDPKFKGYATDASSAKGAFWFTDDPATAKAYAVYAAEDAPVQRALKEADNLEKIAQKSGNKSDWAKYDEAVKQYEDLGNYDNTYKRRQDLANVKEAYVKGDFLEVDAKGKTPQELSTDDTIDSWLNSKIEEAQKSGKAGIKITNIDDAVGLYNKPSTHYAVFNPDQIKTKSQLTDIYNQAKGKGKLVQEFKSEIEGPTPKIEEETIVSSPKDKAKLTIGEELDQTQKLKVAGGEFSTKRFNTTKELDSYMRKTSFEIEDEIVKSRRGKVDWDKTLKDSEEVGIAKFLDRNKAQGVDAKQVVAGSRHIKALGENINSLRNALQQDPGNIRTQQELAQSISMYKAVMAQTLGDSAEAGRALNAHKILAQSLESPQEKFVAQVLRDESYGENMDLVVTKLMKFAPDDKLGMMKFLMEVKPSDSVEKIEGIYYNNLLSNPATHIVNTLGNTARTLWHVSTKPFRVATDVAASKVRGTPRQEWMNEWGPEAVGALMGLRDGARNARFAYENGIRPIDVDELRVRQQPLKGKLGKGYSAPSRLLVAMDEFFRAVNKNMEINRQAVRQANVEGLKGDDFTKRVAELMEAPTPDMTKQADELASELLYQKASEELSSVGGIRDVVKIPLGKWGELRPLKFIVPFIQVPVNVAKFGYIETTPVGGAGTLAKASLTGVEGVGGQLEFNRKIASSAMGSLMLAGLASYFSEEKIIGAPPRSQKEKDAFYASGKQPYSVKIGDNWVQYNRLPDPLASHLSIIAGMYDTFDETGAEPPAERVAAVLGSFTRQLSDRTFLSGVSDLLNAIEDPERYGGSLIRNIAASLAVPYSSLSGAITRATDRTVREPENIQQAIMARVPGLSTQVPAKLSELEPGGEAIRKAPAYQEFIPVRTTKEIPYTPEQIIRLPAKTLYNDVLKGRSLEDQARVLYVVKELNPSLYSATIKRIKDERLKTTKREKRLRTMSVSRRAIIIRKEMDKLETPDERYQYLLNLHQKGILTEATIKEMAKTQNEV